MPFSREGVELTDGFRQQLIVQRDQAGALVGREWRRTVDFDDFEASHSRFVERADRIVASSQVGAAVLANMYFSNFVGAELASAALAGFDQATQTIAGELAAAKLEQQVDRLIQGIRGRTRDGRRVRDVLAPSGPAALNVLGQGRGRFEADLVGRARAVRVATTETVDAANEMLHGVMNQAAPQGVSGWWRMTGNDPCRACLGYATRGKVHTRSRIQIHPNCRCSMVPALGDLPDVEPLETGLQKWADMSAAEQDELMGPEVAEMLREGRISFADLVEQQRNPDWDDTISERSKSALAELADEHADDPDWDDVDIEELLRKRQEDLFSETAEAAAAEDAVDVDALLAGKLDAMFEDVPESSLRARVDEVRSRFVDGELRNAGIDPATGRWSVERAMADAEAVEQLGRELTDRASEIARERGLAHVTFDSDLMDELNAVLRRPVFGGDDPSVRARAFAELGLDDEQWLQNADRHIWEDRRKVLRETFDELGLEMSSKPVRLPAGPEGQDRSVADQLAWMGEQGFYPQSVIDSVTAWGARGGTAIERPGWRIDTKTMYGSTFGGSDAQSAMLHEFGHAVEYRYELSRLEYGQMARFARFDQGIGSRIASIGGGPSEFYLPRRDNRQWPIQYMARHYYSEHGFAQMMTADPASLPRPIAFEYWTVGLEGLYGNGGAYSAFGGKNLLNMSAHDRTVALEQQRWTAGVLALLAG